MTPGDLYERCVALGLCERATYDGCRLRWYDSGVPRWVLWEDKGPWPVNSVKEAEDLACMTVLRALTATVESDYTRHYLFRVSCGAANVDLESLCLCLLRANGHEITPPPTPKE